MSESKYNLSFKIKQHTPIIHFQHDQSGATLRASELKPKLDKFLFDKCENKKCPALPFGEKGNLDYKVKITSGDNIEVSEIKSNTLYFGNMGSASKKCFVTSKSNIMLDIFSFNKKIIQAIKDNIADFFLFNNFGTRQSKGFGSFYLDESSSYYKEPKLKYKFSVQLRPNKDVFYYIDLFYKTLRGGINGMNKNSFYFKSMMFSYAKSKNIQWDKKSIKEYFYNSDLKKQISEHGSDILKYSSKDKYLMKDLLGLSSRESWRKPYESVITKNNRDIDRFKSPIMFKPLKQNDNNGYNVFFYAKEINNFLNKKFEIKSKNSKSPLYLSTPKNFDVDDFIQFALKVDLNTHVDSMHHGKREFKIIKEIYSDINKNLK